MRWNVLRAASKQREGDKQLAILLDANCLLCSFETRNGAAAAAAVREMTTGFCSLWWCCLETTAKCFRNSSKLENETFLLKFKLWLWKFISDECVLFRGGKHGWWWKKLLRRNCVKEDVPQNHWKLMIGLLWKNGNFEWNLSEFNARMSRNATRFLK